MTKKLPMAMRNKMELSKKKEKGDPRRPPKITLSDNDGQTTISESDTLKVFEAMGTGDGDLCNNLLRQVGSVFAFSDEDSVKKSNLALSVLYGIKPRDELEAMLAVQMIGVHNLAMAFMGNAILPGQTFEGSDANVARATKLLRTFTAQMEALNRHRGGGQQKVTVEHVHVSEGGQAIVGVIGGGRGKHENRE